MAGKKTDQQTKDSRELVYSKGSSNKFWNITLDGSSHTVAYGPVGTAGQSKSKDFDSIDAARKSYDKLVAQKLAKGYVDATYDAADSSAAVNLQITREIDLDPEDWSLAGFRPRVRLERGEPAPFDRDACLRRLMGPKIPYDQVQWQKLKLPAALSAEEAHFWLVATTTHPKYLTTEELAGVDDTIGKQQFDGKVTPDDARRMVYQPPRMSCQSPVRIPDITVLALSHFVTLEQFVDLAAEIPPGDREPREVRELSKALVAGFRKYYVPYLTDSQIAGLQDHVRKNWDPHQEPSSAHRFPFEYYVAAAIGMHDEVYQVTSHWPDRRFGYRERVWTIYDEDPEQLVFGLGSAELVEREWRRLGLRMLTAEHVRAFLACTEFAALDCVADSIIASSDKKECKAMLKVFARVRAPEAAEPMLRCRLESKAPIVARDCLDKNVGNAVAGLIQTATGRGKPADAAKEYLQVAERQGHGALIAACKEKAGKSEQTAGIQEGVLEEGGSVTQREASSGKRADGRTEDVDAEEEAEPISATASDHKPVDSAPVSLEITREIDLEPEDWSLGGFRPRRRLERSEPRPFDKDECMKRLSVLKKPYEYIRWDHLRLPDVMSQEEAHLWLLATTTELDSSTNLQLFEETLSKHPLDGKVTIDAVVRMIDEYPYPIADETALALCNMLPPEQFVDLVTERHSWTKEPWEVGFMLEILTCTFLDWVVPYLTDAQISKLRDHILRNWNPHKEVPSFYIRLPEEYYIAAAIGMHDEVYQVTSHWVPRFLVFDN